MRALFILAAVAALALAGGEVEVKLSLDGNLNLTDADEHFSFRYVDTTSLTALGVLGFSSASVKADVDDDAKASADAMIGFGMLPISSLLCPFGVLAYGSGKAAVDFDWKDMNWMKPSFAGKLKGGIVAMAAYGMQEVDEDGKDVGDFIKFNSPVVPLDRRCYPSKISGDDDNLIGLSCRYKPLGEGVGVTATLVSSKVAGIMEYGHTPVSPRSYEMIIAIDDFDFKDKKKNHVRMYFGLYTLSGEGEIEGESYVGKNEEGGDDLYLAMSRYAVVEGDRTKVEVNIRSGSADGKISADVNTAISAVLGAKFDMRIATVDLPVGAKNFIYDPAMGVGENVYDAGASTIALSALAALICALVALF